MYSFIAQKIDLKNILDWYYASIYDTIHMSHEVTIIDLSSIFDENGYIDKNDEQLYQHNSALINIKLIQTNDNPIKIGKKFLNKCHYLISIDASQITNVVHIDDNFCFQCANLQKITINLKNLISIKDYFFSNCYSLSYFEAIEFNKITTIGTNFFSDCSSLAQFDTNGFENLTTINDNFFDHCDSLSLFDTRGLCNVTTIGNNFLNKCQILYMIHGCGLLNVITIGNDFLYYCENLRIFDVSDFASVVTIGDNFLYSCHRLSDLDKIKFTNLTSIGDLFLFNCNGLTSIHLIDLTKLKTIGDNFLMCSINGNFSITFKNPSKYLREKIMQTQYQKWCQYQLFEEIRRPVLHLTNVCII